MVTITTCRRHFRMCLYGIVVLFVLQSIMFTTVYCEHQQQHHHYHNSSSLLPHNTLANSNNVSITNINNYSSPYPRCLQSDDVSENNRTIHITHWNYGRLGNSLVTVEAAMVYALRYGCNLLLPDTMIGLNNYLSPNPFFCAPTNQEQQQMIEHCAITGKRHIKPTLDEIHSKLGLLVHNHTVCNVVKTSNFWWDYAIQVGPNPQHPLIALRFRAYLGLNETHSFGHQCSPEACIGVHVRSGDVFNGVYNESDGHWKAAPNIHPGYEQPPLEYYLSAIRNFRNRQKQRLSGNSTTGKSSGIARIACEDFNNPVCEIFQVLAQTDPSIEIVKTDLLTTLQTITCCEEVALALSTFSRVLTLSPRLKHLHHYRRPRNCNEASYVFDDTTYTAKGYNMSRWHNSEVERHHMLQPYEMEENTCYYHK